MTIFANPADGSVEAAGDYVAAILDLLGDRDPLDVLAHTAETLRELILDVDGRLLAQPEAPRKWSVTQVVAHLADSELVWSTRLRFVLAEDRPDLTGYDQDRWAGRLKYSERDIVAELELFEVVRRANLARLRAMDPDDRNRVGLHAERGEESVELMERLYAGHDLVHLRQARRVLAAVGATS